MCPRNKSDLGHTLPPITSLKTFFKELSAVRPKTLTRRRKRKRKAIAKRYSLKHKRNNWAVKFVVDLPQNIPNIRFATKHTKYKMFLNHIYKIISDYVN